MKSHLNASVLAWIVAVVAVAATPACVDGPSGRSDSGSDADAGDAVNDVEDEDGEAEVEEEAEAEVEEEADGEDVDDAEADVTDPAFFWEPDPSRILADIEVLASDTYAGRKAGTAGGALAIGWAEDRLETLGLDPAGDDSGYRQPFAFEQWEQTALSGVTIGVTELEEGTTYRVMDMSGSASLTAEMIFVGHGITVPAFVRADWPDCPFAEAGYDDYAGMDVTGKIVIVLRHGPQDDSSIQTTCPANEACTGAPCLWNFYYKAANADLHGAAAMFQVQDYRHDPEIMEGATVDGFESTDFASLFVDRSAIDTAVPDMDTWAGEIDASFAPSSHATGVDATVSVATEVRTVEAENLISIVPGTDATLSAESVVFGAHIDHMGTDIATGEIMHGADDNASGTATLLELARGIDASGLVPRRTIVLAVFDAEESGLVGSFYQVEYPARPIDGVVAMFSLDMVGAGDGSGMQIYGGGTTLSGWLADLMEGVGDESWGYVIDRVAPLPLSDHAPYNEAGIPAVLAMTRGPHSTYHTPADTADGIELEDLRTAARLTWRSLVALALGTESEYTGAKSGRSRFVLEPRSFDRLRQYR